MYSGGEPELIDGDVFRTTVPLSLSFNGVNDKSFLNDNLNDKLFLDDKLNENEDYKRILSYISTNGAINTAQTAQTIGRSHSTARRILLRLVDENILIPVGANKNKTYRLKSDI